MWDLFETHQFEFNHGELRSLAKCPKCGRKFRQRCKLMHHITTKHNSLRSPNGKLFQCQHCQVKFIHKQSLRKHTETHHADGSGPSAASFLFMCRECDEKFDCDYSLWCHMMLHALSRPADPAVVKQYPCTNCSLKFFHKKDLKKHKDSFHGYPRPVEPITVPSFGCDMCPEKFTSKRDRQRHRGREHHTGRLFSPSDSFEKLPYQCRVCKSRFSTSTYLQWHMNLHRPRSRFTLSNLLDRLKCATTFDLIAQRRWHLTSEKEKILRSQSERHTLDLSVVDNVGSRFKAMVQSVGSALSKLVPKVKAKEKKLSHGVDKLYRNTCPNWYV